jgi:hypothetical protein
MLSHSIVFQHFVEYEGSIPNLQEFCICSYPVHITPSHLSSLVIRVPGYRSRGPGSIPGTTRFSEK